jgi:hypothetical protein
VSYETHAYVPLILVVSTSSNAQISHTIALHCICCDDLIATKCVLDMQSCVASCRKDGRMNNVLLSFDDYKDVMSNISLGTL